MKNKFIDNLRVHNLDFYNKPIKYEIKDYNDVIEKIAKLASKYKEILSIYTFGSVSAGGISDLDLIFVLRDGAKLPDFLKKNYFHRKFPFHNLIRKKYFDEKSRYVLFHPFFIITENIMRNIRYIYPSSEFKKIYGKTIAITKPNKNELKKIKAYLTIDIILRHYPLEYLTFFLSRRIDTRICLVRINALSHSFRVFKELSGRKKSSWTAYSREVDLLRKRWFYLKQEDRKQKLLKLLKEAVHISVDFIKDYNSYLMKNKYPLINVKKESIEFKGIKHRLSFIKSWNAEKSISQSIEHFKKYKTYYSILPMSILTQLCCYSSFDGGLSSYIRKRLSINCYQKTIDETLKKRINLLNEQVEYANKLKHSHYPCFFPLGYKTERGLRNKLAILFIMLTNNSVFRKILYTLRGMLR